MKKSTLTITNRYTAKYAVFFDGLYIEELYEGNDLDEAIAVADQWNNENSEGCCFVINGKCLNLKGHKREA